MTVALDPTLLGTDLSFFGDIGLRWTLATGQLNLAYALLRRLSSDPGSLYYDPSYGFNLIGSLNGGFSRTALATLQSRIVAECEKDPRVQSCACTVVANGAAGTLTVSLIIESAEGPFDLVLGVSQLSVSVLNAGQLGAPTAVVAAAGGASVAPSGVGPAGPTGPAGPGSTVPGPTGPAGVSNQSFSSGLDIGGASDASGTELVQWQYAIDFSGQPAGTLTLDIDMLASSDVGTATYRAYVGTTFATALGVAPSGTLVATATRNGAGFVRITLEGTFTNPTGRGCVQITMQSSGVGVNCYGKNIGGAVVA